MEETTPAVDTNELKKKRNRRILFWSAVALGAVTVLSGNYGAYQIFKIKKQRSAIVEEIERLKKEQEILLDQRERLKTDLDMVEKVAREKYSMIREGEKVYQVVPKQEEKKKASR